MVTFLTRSVAAEKDGYPASCESVLGLLLIRDQISFRQQRNMIRNMIKIVISDWIFLQYVSM